jgi:putative oxidoreductase
MLGYPGTGGAAQDFGTLIGRVLSAIFVWSGFGKLAAPGRTTVYFASLGVPLPALAWVVAVLVEFVGGLTLLLGFQARLTALLLAAWCIVTALAGHTNFADPDMQIHFMKNIAMAGGFT